MLLSLSKVRRPKFNMEETTTSLVGDATKARFIAAFIDNFIALFTTLIAVRAVPENMTVLRGVVLVAAYLGYYFVLEAVWGRTLGKYFQGLVVKKIDGRPADWTTVLVRTLFRILEVNPVLLGAIPAGIVLITSEHKQRLGDIFADSVVVPDKSDVGPSI